MLIVVHDENNVFECFYVYYHQCYIKSVKIYGPSLRVIECETCSHQSRMFSHPLPSLRVITGMNTLPRGSGTEPYTIQMIMDLHELQCIYVNSAKFMFIRVN